MTPDMPVLQSKIDPRSEGFAANAKAMRKLVDELHTNIDRIAEGGGARYAERHKKRGKLLARERISRLIRVRRFWKSASSPRGKCTPATS